MKTAIINGTNRKGNQTAKISAAVLDQTRELGHETAIVTLENFTELFRGDYITYETATKQQREDIRNLAAAEMLIYIIPTYHSGIPSPLKNFFDTLKCFDCYDGKVILLIAGSDKNQDLGARQAQQIINGMLSFQKAHSFIHPRITIVDFNDIDTQRLQEQIKLGAEYVNLIRRNEDVRSPLISF